MVNVFRFFMMSLFALRLFMELSFALWIFTVELPIHLISRLSQKTKIRLCMKERNCCFKTGPYVFVQHFEYITQTNNMELNTTIH